MEHVEEEAAEEEEAAVAMVPVMWMADPGGRCHPHSHQGFGCEDRQPPYCARHQRACEQLHVA